MRSSSNGTSPCMTKVEGNWVSSWVQEPIGACKLTPKTKSKQVQFYFCF